jgi:integrase
MKGSATQQASDSNVVSVKHRPAPYRKVFDERKRRVRGMWERNGSYYAQMTIPHPTTALPVVRRVRLEDKDGNPVTSLAQAKLVMARLQVQREDETLKISAKRTPTLAEYAQTYLDRLEKLGSAKRPATIALERAMIDRLTEGLGTLRLREITPLHVHNHMANRMATGVKGRTVNVEITALRNVLRAAKEDKLINSVPEFKRLEETAQKRRCLTADEIQRVAEAALECPRTGQMVHDFILLMAYCGSRRSETLRLRWPDVDFKAKQLTIGADGLSKNGEHRTVDFNPDLEKHLRQMAKRQIPDSEFLFPSPRRSANESPHALSFNKSLREARQRAGVKDFSPHMCRHFFASMALMSGVDIHTVAAWLGHRDNGVLLAKTYSHLLNEHKREMAKRVVFTPRIVDSEAAA